MTDVYVAIKSYKRAGKVRTLDVFPFAYVWVPESQGDDYRRFYGDRVVTIPDAEDGNLCRKQNAILNRTPSEYTLILDDDIPSIGVFERGRSRHRMLPDEIARMIAQGFTLAEDLGVSLWGINQYTDPMAYDTYQPFSLLGPVLGPFHGHIRPTLRYDESVLGKDDYDFWLQTIRKDHRTLRLEKYSYQHDHGKLAGGWVSQRTEENERAGIARMTQKWGGYYRGQGMAGGKSATGQNYLNSRIQIPIKGC
jgi:hypothetical protein